MKVSGQGLDLLTQREGKRNNAYLDSVGVWTIGVGHTGPEVNAYLNWTDAEVEAALAKDIEWCEEAIDEAVTVPLAQNQYDALASFAFNVIPNIPPPETMAGLNP